MCLLFASPPLPSLGVSNISIKPPAAPYRVTSSLAVVQFSLQPQVTQRCSVLETDWPWEPGILPPRGWKLLRNKTHSLYVCYADRDRGMGCLLAGGVIRGKKRLKHHFSGDYRKTRTRPQCFLIQVRLGSLGFHNWLWWALRHHGQQDFLKTETLILSYWVLVINRGKITIQYHYIMGQNVQEFLLKFLLVNT